MSGYRRIAAAAAAVALTAGATPAAVASPAVPQVPKPGETYFKGAICLQHYTEEGPSRYASKSCLTVLRHHHAFEALFITTSPNKFNAQWDVVLVGHVFQTWPFKDLSLNRDLHMKPVVNFEWAPDGHPSGECIDDGPASMNQVPVLMGACSPTGQNSRDKYWSHMVWAPTELILGVHDTNATEKGATRYCLTAVDVYAGSGTFWTNMISSQWEALERWWTRRL
jgi:hypothetical protein